MSDIQNLIIETATRLFADHCDHKTLQLAEQGTWPAEFWTVLEENGLTQASLPESLGGAGGSLSDAFTVLRIAGQFAVPLPIAETYLASWMLASSGRDIPAGPLTVAFAHDGTALQMQRRADRWSLTGTVSQVSWARHARQIVVLGQGEDGSYLALVEPDSATIHPGRNLAGEPRDTLTFSNVEVAQIMPTTITPDWVWNRAALTRAVLMTGALEKLLQLSVRYTGERVQFGQPLSRLQAVQQQLALLAGEVAAARIAVEAAVLAAEQGEATAAIAAAKIRVGEAAGQATAIAHQVHGAMGYTYEYPLHFLTRRLWAWRDEFGSESEWARKLGQIVAAQGAEALWPFLAS
jgi:alkylation response protein AidB-like acyl-CoA dehydrogenase